MAQTSALYGWNYREFAVVRVEFLLTYFNLSLTFILSLFKGKKETKFVSSINKEGLSSVRGNSQEARKALKSF